MPDRNWDETALSVIENAGLKDEYLEKIPEDIKAAPSHSGEFTVPDCGCLCHKAGFSGLIGKGILFFSKLFKANTVCECGRNHY